MLSASALRWTWIAAAVALFVVVNLAYALWKARRQTSSSRQWPVAPGVILSSDVKVPATHSSDDDDTDCSSCNRCHRHPTNGSPALSRRTTGSLLAPPATAGSKKSAGAPSIRRKRD